MRARRIRTFRPDVEPLEAKRPLSAGVTAPAEGAAADATIEVTPAAEGEAVATLASTSARAGKAASKAGQGITAARVDPKPTTGYLVYRITNPNRFNNSLDPPFQHVLVQTKKPIPGQTYNVLFVVVRNGTAKTFDANSRFLVKFPGAPRTKFPILTGDQTWKPGERFVFYVLTKEYYPLPSQVHSGFEFSLDRARSVAIPGPSGIFLRVKYRPATFDATLDKIVAFGPGNQGGIGAKYGLPNTAIYEFLSAKTDRPDFGGYF